MKNQKIKIRPIVRAAFKVDELIYQFQTIDVDDRLLENGSIEEVNEKYSDSYIVGEALNRYDIAVNDEYNSDDPDWQKDAKQLRRFLVKWNKGNFNAVAEK